MADKEPDRYPDSEGPFAGPNNTFPVGNADRVRNAWSRIHQDAVIANHSAEEVASIKSKIRTAAKKFGIKLEEDDGKRSLMSLDWRQAKLWLLAHRPEDPIR